MKPPLILRGAHIVTRSIAFCALLTALLGGSTSRAALFLDLSVVTPGSVGTPGAGFTGTLGGIVVTGTIATGAPSFSFNAVGAGIGGSTIAGTSPQYSYSTVYSPTIALTDRVGFTSLGVSTNVITISFSLPVTNPVFHVANLDGAEFNFTGTPGLTTLTLLKGNDGAGDGIDPLFGGAPFLSHLVHDATATPASSDATPPSTTPPIAGARSAYGSVQLDGTFSTISFGAGSAGFSDDGSFTISIVPEPGSLILAGMGLLSAAGFTRRRMRKNPAQALPARH